MRIWIDATEGKGALRLFGMSLLERVLRGIREAGLAPAAVRVELSPGASPSLPDDLAKALPLELRADSAPLAERLAAAAREARGRPLLALSADTVVDTRLLRHLAAKVGSVAYRDGEPGRPAAVLRLEGELPEGAAAGDALLALVESSVASGAAKELRGAECEAYIPKLRRRMRFYLRRVDTPETRDRVERFLFWSNYKGSTDFLTKYVYPPFVWAMVRPLARWRVHPNWVTALDVVATVAAVPFFALGMWVPGLALAYLMSVLDSVDGKLARLTFTSTAVGDVMDHGLDIVHPPVWYAAWGLALGEGSVTSGPFVASLVLFAFYVIDRLLAPLFKKRTGMSIHAYTDLDVRVRTFISRRNVNLAFMTAALALHPLVPSWSLPVVAFYAIAAWQVACCIFHADRVIRYWNAREVTAVG